MLALHVQVGEDEEGRRNCQQGGQCLVGVEHVVHAPGQPQQGQESGRGQQSRRGEAKPDIAVEGEYVDDDPQRCQQREEAGNESYARDDHGRPPRDQQVQVPGRRDQPADLLLRQFGQHQGPRLRPQPCD